MFLSHGNSRHLGLKHARTSLYYRTTYQDFLKVLLVSRRFRNKTLRLVVALVSSWRSMALRYDELDELLLMTWNGHLNPKPHLTLNECLLYWVYQQVLERISISNSLKFVKNNSCQKTIVKLKCLLKILVKNLLGHLEQPTSLGFSLLFYFHLVDHVDSHFTLRNQWPWMHTRWFLSKYLEANGNSLKIIYFPLLLRANQRLQMFLNVATLMPLLLPMNIDLKLIG